MADQVVFEANFAKFTNNQELKNRLLATGDKLLVECSPSDSIWGNGLSIEDSKRTPVEEWPGSNRLGKALVWVREEILRIEKARTETFSI